MANSNINIDELAKKLNITIDKSKDAIIIIDPKLKFGGYDLPISENNYCIPENKPEKSHFPMKASHLIPGTVISFAFICLCLLNCAPPEEFGNNHDDDEKVKQGVTTLAWMVQNCLLSCIAIWALIGMGIALIYSILLYTFVDFSDGKLINPSVPNQKLETTFSRIHLAVPTICVLVQCSFLVVALLLAALAKWLFFIQARSHKVD